MARRIVLEHIVESQVIPDIGHLSSENDDDKEDLLNQNANNAIQLELGILDQSLSAAREYGIVVSWTNERFRRLYIVIASNTIDTLKSSEHLRKCISSGDITLRTIASIKPIDAFPDMWRESVISVNNRAEEAQRGPQPIVTTTLFKCSRCRQNKCTFREIQLRSADEPMTVFIACLNCGHRWKQ